MYCPVLSHAIHLLRVGAGALHSADARRDLFNRSYIANLKLITGYVNDDKAVIHEVNRKATWSAIFIVILCVLIYFIVKWAIALGDWFISLF